MMAEQEIPLSGGTITPTVRVGESVRRVTGVWSLAVHALLQHLEAVGFNRAPRLLGIDLQGREMLSYIEGEAGYHDAERVHPPYLWSDAILSEAGQLLRLLHDATEDWTPPAHARWQLVYPDASQNEVICHNDFAPYNSIFQAGHLQAVIDFDMAGPGPRIWDVAYAAYRFVPLYSDTHCVEVGLTEPPDRGRRLRLFCDAYRLEKRQTLVKTIIRRVEAVQTMIVDRAMAGEAAFQGLVAEGHLEFYAGDLRFLTEQSQTLQAQLDDVRNYTR
jgi:hypothetical protein